MIVLLARLAARGLWRHRRRTFIVGFGVAFGMFAVTTQRGLVAGVRKQMTEELVLSRFGHLTITGRATISSAGAFDGGPNGLVDDPGEVVAEVRRAAPEARTVPGLSALGMAFGDLAGTSRVVLWGFVPEDDGLLMSGLARRMRQEAPPLKADSIYLGAALAERLGSGPDGIVTLTVVGPQRDLRSRDFEVAAILGPGAPWQDYFVYLRLKALQDLMGVGSSVRMLKVYLDDGLPAVARTGRRLKSLLQGPDSDLEVAQWQESGKLYKGIIRATRIQAGLIEVVLLLAVALSVGGTQILAVHERQREIGTMRALGTSRGAILQIFLLEGALLALFAGGLGALAGMLVTTALGTTGLAMDAEAFHWMVGGPRLVPVVNLRAIGWAFVELLGVVTLAGLYPAARAAALLPTEALRGGAA